ncbi:hypothetical protein K469DRAFT_721153 [Zopfia rhizophila CBS 207.26]|uniref:Uncharacterized protein n=1 Tax=Zopfia rhizophila CBS 207.26 TaxID=1314779 RepID=A0A6A6DF03_9PEZI|nr:hypothetical protein K469DRAFT_721153 [Zopfia rhizophila CBS 207.26]
MTTKARESYRNKTTTKKAGDNAQGAAVQREIETDDQDESKESQTGSAIEVRATTPTAPQRTRTTINAHLNKHVVAEKVRAFSAKSGERSASAARKSNRLAPGKANANTNAQSETLTNMVTLLLREVEGQKQVHTKLLAEMEEHKEEYAKLPAEMEEQKEEHAKQIETLTRTFPQETETLKAEVKRLTDTVKTQLSNMQTVPSGSPSYADLARTPPNSQPSNLRSLSANTTPSTVTDTLYCTVDTSRVEEEDKQKAQSGTIRQAIEKEPRMMEERGN